MIKGSCLCGAVSFELSEATGPFELCHCSRCRKSSGSAFVAGLGVLKEHYTLLSGEDFISHYDADIIDSPPAYRRSFCRRCGCLVPDPSSDCFEIAAGLLDDDPAITPDKHIFVEHLAPWYEIADDLPQLNRQQLIKWRTEFGSIDTEE